MNTMISRIRSHHRDIKRDRAVDRAMTKALTRSARAEIEFFAQRQPR